MKLTEWYEGDVKPVRVGVYQVQGLLNTKDFYAYWNGKYWQIEDENGSALHFQYRRWRGIEQE